MGLDPETNEGDDAYSPSDTRSFTPPPQGLKFTQPILDKVSDITIPPNLQEILANVKRQETSKVDPYLPSKPSASFLTSVNTSRSTKSEKYSTFSKGTTSSLAKESKTTSTLSSMSELDLIKKAAEQLAAETLPSTTPPLVLPPSLYPTIVPPPTPVMPPPLPPPPPAATTIPIIPSLPAIPIVSSIPLVATNQISPIASTTSIIDTTTTTSDVADNKTINYPISDSLLMKTNLASNQPRPPGLEDDEIPSFLTTPAKKPESPSKIALPTKFIPKSGVVLSVKRKLNDNDSTPSKTPRTKSSRWGQPPPSE